MKVNSINVKNISTIPYWQKLDKTISNSKDIAKEFSSKILGYSKLQQEIFNNICSPLIHNSAEINIPAILLSGPEKLYLNYILTATGNILSNYNVNFVEVDSSSLKQNELIQQIFNCLETNKKNYLENNIKSIIAIKDAEKIISINDKEVLDNVRNICDENDYKIIRNKKVNLVNFFKNILDSCHNLPKSDEDSGYATMFVMTTNVPHLIHPDLRDMKLKKIYFDFLSDETMKEFIFDSYNKVNELYLKNYNTSILKNKTINDIKTLNSKQTYSLINNFIRPNEYIGSYGVNDIFSSVRNSLFELLTTNPASTFLNSFARMISQIPRQYSPEIFKKYQLVKDSIYKEHDEYEKLILLDEDGMLSRREKEKLNNIIENEQKLLSELVAKKRNDFTTPDENLILSKLLNRYPQ